MGSSSPRNTTTTQVVEYPEWLRAPMEANIGRANALADAMGERGYQSYSPQDRISGMNQLQLNALGMASGGVGGWAPYMQQGVNSLQGSNAYAQQAASNPMSNFNANAAYAGPSALVQAQGTGQGAMVSGAQSAGTPLVGAASAGPGAFVGPFNAGQGSFLNMNQLRDMTTPGFSYMSAARVDPAAQWRASGMGAAQAGNVNVGPAAQWNASQMNAAQAGAAQTNRGDIRNVTAGNMGQQMNAQSLGRYINPYNDLVTKNALADLEETRKTQQVAIGDQAAKAKAFGGSRHGLVEAQNNAAVSKQAGDLSLRSNQAGFDRATQLMQDDINRRMQSDLANQGYDAQVALGNTANRQQTGLQNASFLQAARGANMDASNQARSQNAGAVNARNAMQAQLAQQTGLQNAQFRQQAGQFNSDAYNRAASENAGALNNRSFLQANLQQGANQQNQQAFNASSAQGAQNVLQGMMANQNAANNMAQFNANLGQQGALANQQSANQMAQFNAANQMQAGLANQSALQNNNQFNANLSQQAQMANQDWFNQMAQFNAGQNLQAQGMNQNAANQMAQFNAQMAQGANLQNANNTLQADLAMRGIGLDAASQMAQNGGQFGQFGSMWQGMNANDMNNLMTAGNQLQDQDQLYRDFGYQEWLNNQNFPIDLLNMRMSAVTNTPYQPGSSVSSPLYRNRGANFLGGAMMGGGLASSLGASNPWAWGAAAAGGLMGAYG